ncbi:hypothetical protein F2P56_031882 [Juglans regia]|uniref:Glucosamine inositolphosphorylceramide transferase 1 N-terminal domain-containing protein n=1 Tax=Juglans regia TaxID=51240 RepID=A0A833WUI4_JUGRE|nr:hypothetical protein F2P56_031882 [Juglans regia]
MGGLSPTMMATKAAGCGGGANGGGASGNCCDMSVRCWCRWHCKDHQHGGHHRLLSSGFLFFLGCFVLLGSIGMLYAWLAFTPTFRTTLAGSRPSSSLLGCQEDNEGSWSVGVFYGDSPFSLKPIEAMNVWKDGSAAWPVANPVLTCASVSDAGFPSNFVADPFLYIKVVILSLILDFPLLSFIFFTPLRFSLFVALL